MIAGRRRPLFRLMRGVGPRRRGDSVAPRAALSSSVAGEAAGFAEKATTTLEGVDFEKLAEELEAASPLVIVDKALDLFGNDIAIAFR